MTPFDGSGNFSRTDGGRSGANTWVQAREADLDVLASDHDTHDTDLADGLELAVLRDGQNTPAGDLPMGGYKHTGVDAATAATDYATYGQLLDVVVPFVAAAFVGGSGNAIALTPSPAATSYTVGKGYRFFVNTQNTGAVTLQVSSLAAVDLRRVDGSAFDAGDLPVGRYVIAIYDGSQFRSNVAEIITAGGGGDITSVTAGAGLTGGGTTGAVTLAVIPTTLSVSDIPGLPASKITSGAFSTSRIPNLPASQTTSGRFDAARIVWSGTQAQFDALSPNSNTVYLVTN